MSTAGCARCGAKWSGYNTSHCGACHRTFGGVSAFDLHRRGGECLDPAMLGLVQSASRPYPCWSGRYGDES